MTKIKIEGPSARIVGDIIEARLRELGIKANFWWNTKPGEVARCRRDATRTKAVVSIVAMSK